jgi:hypothetical protein
MGTSFFFNYDNLIFIDCQFGADWDYGDGSHNLRCVSAFIVGVVFLRVKKGRERLERVFENLDFSFKPL